MGTLNSLDELKAMMKPAEKKEYQKVDWFRLGDGDSVTARFVEELAEDSPGYSEDRGTSVVIYEHVSPEDFTRKFVCTADTGQCYGCEMNKLHPKTGWYRKRRWYTNMLVDDGKSDPKIVVWSRTVSDRTEFAEILDEAVETGSISNKPWKIKRMGSGTSTRYMLRPGNPDTDPFDWSKYEFFDLMKIVPEIPYENQENWINKDFGSADTSEDDFDPNPKVTSEPNKVEW